ncbi:MAG: hypothetical protein HPY85_12510 [Anaerolineae bacterium]|jgi:hypothetical protein|nr:hypothetical protein [Anaerolineae bacterium]
MKAWWKEGNGIIRLLLLGIGLFNLARGGFHFLAPDSGAGSVAGFDLSQNGDVIIFMLGTIGLTQAAFGVWDLLAAIKMPQLAVFAVALECVKNLLALFLTYVYKPTVVEFPGRYAQIAVFALTAAALIHYALRKRASS